MKDILIKTPKFKWVNDAYEQMEGQYVETHGVLPDAKRAMTLYMAEEGRCPFCEEKVPLGAVRDALEHMVEKHYPEDYLEFKALQRDSLRDAVALKNPHPVRK